MLAKIYEVLNEIDAYDVKVELKHKHSKTYYGRYYVGENRIVIYMLDSKGNMYNEAHIIRILKHELIHYIQHHYAPYWTRFKGVMHDTMFMELEQMWCDYV